MSEGYENVAKRIADAAKRKGKPIDWETEIIYRGRPLSDYRAFIIEECARVAERNSYPGTPSPKLRAEQIAAAIRALKDA